MATKKILGDRQSLLKFSIVTLVAFFAGEAMAADSIGTVASTIYSSFNQLSKLVTSGAYLGGLAFAVGAIMKFKQHKDNPTQVPIGTPIALVMIAACLLFLPSILGVAGQSIFSGGTVASSTGTAWAP